MISTNKELRPKKLAKEKLTKVETKKRDEAAKRRDDLKKKLQRFLTRIPAFMYLTDDREKTLYDIITQIETGLFEKVTSLSLRDFNRLVNAGVFNDSKMNDAVWKFRSFEEPSLSYSTGSDQTKTVGGWTLRREERFAELVEVGFIEPGDLLRSVQDDLCPSAVVTDDFGILVSGIRYESLTDAANAVGHKGDGWQFWGVETDDGLTSLEDFV